MSESDPTATLLQASLDSYLGTVIVQGFVIGIYTILLFRTIRSAFPSLRNGQHILLMAALVVLYCLAVINFGVSWGVTRSILILNNTTRQDEVMKMFSPDTFNIIRVGNSATVIAILIADALMVWRCSMLWSRSKMILFAFSPALLTELVLIPVLLNLMMGPEDMIHLFFFISMGITVIATSLIIFRILNISGGGGAAGAGRHPHGHLIEIFVESGILYSTILFITGILQVLTTAPITVSEAGSYFTAVLVPVIGIASTLISDRIMTSTEGDNEKWSQPVSFFKFKNFSWKSGNTTAGTTTIVVNSLPFNMNVDEESTGKRERTGQ